MDNATNIFATDAPWPREWPASVTSDIVDAEEPPVSVVIVDDSETHRKWLHAIIATDSRLRVVGQAANAEEARSVIKHVDPDVITLDVEMPRMNGIEFLRRIMRLRPMPVVMLSSFTAEGSKIALEAYAIGAVDCIAKPTSNDALEVRQICQRIFAAGKVTVQGGASSFGSRDERRANPAEFDGDEIILVGSSTGGVAALETLIEHMPLNAPPVVIAQHMPRQFLESFAQRLNDQFPQDVRLALNREKLQFGHVRLSPSDGFQTCVVREADGWRIAREASDGSEQFCPSVDRLFLSATSGGKRVGAIILTGIGSDGARGMKELRESGSATIGQSEESCVVYGMPKAAWAHGGVMKEEHPERIPGALFRLFNQQRRT